MTDPAQTGHAEGSAQDDPELLAAFIGPFWQRHYQPSFAAAASGKRFKFNLAAAFAPFWLAWRGFPGTQVLMVIVLLLILGSAAGLSEDLGFALMAIAFLLVCVAEGAVADHLVLLRARRFIARAGRQGLTGDEARAYLRRKGGVSVANVIVLPVLLFLAFNRLIHMMGHSDLRPAYIAAMKSDLRNLVTAQEAYFADYVSYAPRVGTTIGAPAAAFLQPSSGVTITMVTATDSGWSATASHLYSDQVCGVYVGKVAPPLRSTRQEDAPTCEKGEGRATHAH